MGSLAGFAAGWTIGLCFLALRNAPHGLFSGRRLVAFLEVLRRVTMAAAMVAALILQVAMLLTQPPVIAAASLVAAAVGALAAYCSRRLFAVP